MSFFTSLIYFIILIFALQYVEKVYKILELTFKTPNFGLISSTTTEKVTQNLPVLKSEKYVPSTMEHQHVLLEFEKLLTTSLRMDGGQNERWNRAYQPPAVELTESVMNEISRMILCSNDQSENCEGVKELLKTTIFGIKTSKTIIFGFKLNLELKTMSAAQFRIKIHKLFHKTIWPILQNTLDFTNEEREILFVGYESGGSLASLAAWQTLKHFDSVNGPSGGIISNANNQIKVITWDELPLFTFFTCKKYPILSRNHLRFTTSSINESKIRTILQQSGGIDEINYFSAGGEEIKLKATDYTDFMVRTKETQRINTESKEEPEESSALSDSSIDLAFFLKKKDLKELEKERIEEIKNILTLHIDHLNIINSIIFNTFKSFILDKTLAEPNSCASSLANRLSSTIFTGNSIIKCRADNFNVITGTFKIFCSYKVSESKPLAQFLSFDAVLGDETLHSSGNHCRAFMDEIEIKDPANEVEKKKKKKIKNKKNKAEDIDETPKMIKVLRYSGPPPVADSWSTCLYHLFNQRPHIASILSPFQVKTDDNIFPNCSYVPFEISTFNSVSAAAFTNSETRNTGCYIRAPNIGHELLQVYRADPLFFYRAVDPNLLSFPNSCHKVLFHIPYKAEDRTGLSALQQVGTEYLTQIIARNPVERSDVTLWNPRDTESYRTIAFYGSNNIENSDLMDRSNYKEDFENSIIKCLSSPSFPYRDCTTSLNNWIPKACPIVCSRSHGAINFLCKQVKSCPSAGYYVSLSQEGSTEELSNLRDTLMEHPCPQFGFYRVQTNGRNPLSYYSNNVNFNVALFRMPRN